MARHYLVNNNGRRVIGDLHSRLTEGARTLDTFFRAGRMADDDESVGLVGWYPPGLGIGAEV